VGDTTVPESICHAVQNYQPAAVGYLVFLIPRPFAVMCSGFYTHSIQQPVS